MSALLPSPALRLLPALALLLTSAPVSRADKPMLLLDEQVCVATPQTPYNHASTIAALPNGDLLVAWSRGTSEFSADEHVALSRLPAGKRQWSAPVIAAPATAENAGNPVLFLDPKHTLWLFFNRRPSQPDLYWRPQRPFPHQRAYICARISTDGGRTWGPERIVTREPGSQLRCPPIILADGHWLLPIHDERDMTSLVLISSDSGKSWSPSRKMTIPKGGALTPDSPYYREGCIEPAIAQRKDGTVVCMMRYMWNHRQYPPLTWQSISRDNGRTWTAPRQLQIYNPNSGIALLRLRSGAWLLAFNNSPSERTLLTAALSDDEGGMRWNSALLKAGNATYSYPALIQTRDGSIHITYSYSGPDRSTDGIRHAVLTEQSLRSHASPHSAPK